jgi:hypothetical protein
MLTAMTQGSSGIMCTRMFYDTLMVDTLMSVVLKDTFTCLGNPVTLDGMAVRGTPPYQFRWYNSIRDIALTPLNNPNFSSISLSVTPTQTRNYTIELRDSLGCRVYDSVGVSIINQIKQITTTPVTCFGQSTGVISVAVTDTNNSYQFQLNNGSFQSANIFSSLPSGTYTITVKDSNNCNSKVANIYVSQPQQLSGTIAKTIPTCQSGADATLTITASNGKLPYSFNLDSGTYQSSNLFSGLVAKNYVVGIKDSNSCLAYVNTSISNPPKVIAGGITGPNIVAQSSINTYSVFQQNSLNYKWLLSKGTITGGLNTSAVNIRWDSIGTDTLKALVYQDSTCGDTALMQIAIGGVGLADVAQMMGLTVFPNPTQSLLNITLSRLPADRYLYVYDLQGKVKMQQEIQYSQQLDLQDLPSGMYFLVVGEWKGKIVKQ